MSLKSEGGCMLRVNDHQDAGVGTNDVRGDAGVCAEQPPAAIRSRGPGSIVWSGGTSIEEPTLQPAEKERAWCRTPFSGASERTEPSANGAADRAVDSRSEGA